MCLFGYLTMKVVACFIVLMFASVSTDLAGECDLAGFYLELGCTPVPSTDNSTVCPDAFTCPDLHPDPTMCYYRGVPYGDRSTIPQALINNPCSQACSCRVSPAPVFDCAAVDCVEVFDNDMKQQCVNTYELDSCCSTANVCGKDEIAKLKTCEVDDKTYMEGERFEPANTRKTCICTDRWNGTVEEVGFCRDINCGLEIHYQESILQKCAPVFIGNAKECPISFQCPSNSSAVVRSINPRGVSEQCLFGNMTLTVGDEVTVDEKCTKCTCQMPPFVSCSKKLVCDE